MTKKHFILIADALAASRPTVHDDRFAQWTIDVERIADACQIANARFDRDAFLTACAQ